MIEIKVHPQIKKIKSIKSLHPDEIEWATVNKINYIRNRNPNRNSEIKWTCLDSIYEEPYCTIL